MYLGRIVYTHTRSVRVTVGDSGQVFVVLVLRISSATINFLVSLVLIKYDQSGARSLSDHCECRDR